jgi:hypothetical protein
MLRIVAYSPAPVETNASQPGHAPGHDPVTRQALQQPVLTLQRDLLNPTSPLGNPQEHLDRPAAGGVFHHRAGRLERRYRQAGQHQPVPRLDPSPRRLRANPDRVDRPPGPLPTDSIRRLPLQWRRADRQGHLPRRAVGRAGHRDLQPAQRGLGRHRLAQLDGGLNGIRFPGWALIRTGADDPIDPRASDRLGRDEALGDRPRRSEIARIGVPRTAVATAQARRSPSNPRSLFFSSIGFCGRQSFFGASSGSRPRVVTSMTPSASRSGVTTNGTCGKEPVRCSSLRGPAAGTGGLGRETSRSVVSWGQRTPGCSVLQSKVAW